MLHNSVATIKAYTGSSNNKTLTTVASSVRMLISPVSNDILALYPDLPIGTSYSFAFYDDLINVPTGAEITITDSENSESAVNDKFVVHNAVRKQKVAGRILHSGVCIKVT